MGLSLPPRPISARCSLSLPLRQKGLSASAVYPSEPQLFQMNLCLLTYLIVTTQTLHCSKVCLLSNPTQELVCFLKPLRRWDEEPPQGPRNKANNAGDVLGPVQSTGEGCLPTWTPQRAVKAGRSHPPAYGQLKPPGVLINAIVKSALFLSIFCAWAQNFTLLINLFHYFWSRTFIHRLLNLFLYCIENVTLCLFIFLLNFVIMLSICFISHY